MPLGGGFPVTGLPGFKLWDNPLAPHSTNFGTSRVKGVNQG